MSVTSLTGTTWIINSSPAYSPFTYSSPIKQTNIYADFESDGTQYTYISILDLNALMIYYVAESSVSAYSSSSGWSSENKRTITFLGEPYNGGHAYDATTAETIEWLETNAVQVVPDVAISYKGSVIASMNASGTKTLETAGMYCEGDIEVEYTKSGGTITEDGNGDIELGKTGDVALITPLSVTENGTYTASANTGYSPVNVNVSGGGGLSNLIYFGLFGAYVFCEDGMTWREYVDWDYCVGKFADSSSVPKWLSVNGNYVGTTSPWKLYYYSGNNQVFVSPDDVIVSGRWYNELYDD